MPLNTTQMLSRLGVTTKSRLLQGIQDFWRRLVSAVTGESEEKIDPRRPGFQQELEAAQVAAGKEPKTPGLGQVLGDVNAGHTPVHTPASSDNKLTPTSRTPVGKRPS
ncbi:MAG: hypothetical protein DHS20C10_05620 [marine bacterium B5-7]|nr:MAG: hypothetical protein DHS20C10_05620 [marine bacterium B5-7]